MLPTLQKRLLARVEYSRARGSITEPSLGSIYKIYITNIYRANLAFTTSTIGYILYVPHLLARVLISSKPILVESKVLIKTLYNL